MRIVYQKLDIGNPVERDSHAKDAAIREASKGGVAARRSSTDADLLAVDLAHF